MKLVFSLSVLLLSLKVFSQTYCYDRGMASIMQMKTMIIDCDPTIDLSPWIFLEEKLVSNNPVRYKSQALAALRRVDESADSWSQQNLCLMEAKRRYEIFHRLKIQESISWCSSLL